VSANTGLAVHAYLRRFLATVVFAVGIRAPIEEVGREAVGLLVKCIRQKQCEPMMLLPTELVLRQSCGCMQIAN
jgi:DNA-binding LacI/PurR family transcriptional regulator